MSKLIDELSVMHNCIQLYEDYKGKTRCIRKVKTTPIGKQVLVLYRVPLNEIQTHIVTQLLFYLLYRQMSVPI